MSAHLDAIGNVCGRYEGERPGVPCLMLGSHYDTVRDAGKWDGPLGVITAIACVADLNRRGKRLPFAIEVDRVCRRGGGALRLDAARQPRGGRHFRRERPRTRATATACRCAMRWCSSASTPIISARPRGPARELLAYLELHIEQGPVLEAQNLPVGVVTAIAGATRLAARLTGMAGHAGTVPMALRRDALAGAAECIGAIEQFCRTDEGGLVGTVGYIQARPGATNVIPGEVSFTIDIRAPTDMHRKRAVADIVRQIEAIAKRRQLTLQLDVTHENRTAPCAPWLKDADRAGDRSGRVFACSSCRAGPGMTAWR